jgi:TonB family protein
MTAWILYALAVSVFLAGAAFLAERSLRLYGRPARLLWVIAMVASVGVPLVTPLLTQPTSAVSRVGPVVVSGNAPWQVPVDAIEAVGAAAVSLDGVLLAMWIVVSLSLVLWMAWSWIGIRRERTEWVTEMVDGHRVYVSAEVGPAIIDPIMGGIVVPRWLLDAPAAERKVALRHELEHILASDHRLLWGAMLLTAAFPWNLALWWQLRRLKHAVELDCDRRVLAGGISPKAYAELLLRVVTTGSVRGVRPALTEQPSFLRWRIGAMIEQRIRYRIVRSIAYGAVAAALVFIACDTRAPEVSGSAATRPGDVSVEGAQVYNESVVDQTPERLSCPLPEYPSILRQARIEGRVLVQFVVGPDGAVESTSVEVLSASHRAFEAPATGMIERCTFRAGVVEGNAVRTLVQMPVIFAIRQAPIEITTSPAAPTSSSMRGTVYDPPGEPLANARVVVVGTSLTAVTDENGSYTLDIPPGVYQSHAEFGDYRAVQVVGVRVVAGEVLTADFRLSEGGL